MSERFHGTVKFYNATAGFGFIERDDLQGSVYLSSRAAEMAGETLSPDDKVSFLLEPGLPGKAMLAVDVKIERRRDVAHRGKRVGAERIWRNDAW